jgi:hypothetical protein
MAPDTESRTKEHEGRRVKKVDDGWLILNYHKYRGNSLYRNRNGNGATPAPDTGTGTNGNKNRERSNANSNRETIPNREPNRETLRNSCETQDGSRETWHPVEKAAYEALSVESHRQVFLNVRGFAELAADKGEPDFPIACDHLAKETGMTPQGAGKIRRQFVVDGIIEQTAKYDYREGKSARYRWTLETTIPVPAMAEPEQKSDLDDEEAPF